jgi:tetratricopeptide (TPR) repeat protein
MRPFFARVGLAALFVVSAGLVSLPSMAADKVSASVGKPLQEADKALKANDAATALAKVQEAQAVANRTPFDDFTINQFAANVALKQNDLKTAEKYFLAAAAYPDISPADKKNIYTVTVEVATNVQDWPTIVQYGGMLQAMGPLDPNIVEPLAVAYYNSGDHAKALQLAQAQIDADKAAGKQPSQSLMQIVMSSQAGQKDTAGATATLEGLAQDYGSPDDWGRLIDLAFNSRGLTDLQALNLYRLRVATNATTSVDDYAIMATITSKAGYPGETVAFLEHGMARGTVKASDKAGAQLASARTKANADKASLAAFDAQARARKTGEYDVKVAETYFGYGRYAEAEEAAQRAMTKGGMKDPAEAQMVLGMSLAREGKNADAAATFAKVAGSANDQKIAHLWTLYVQRKYTTAATH